MHPTMIFFPASFESTAVSRFDCAVSIDTWPHGSRRARARTNSPTALVDDRRVAEADVNRSGPGHALECAIQRLRPYWRALSGRACMYGSSTCTMSAPAAKNP